MSCAFSSSASKEFWRRSVTLLRLFRKLSPSWTNLMSSSKDRFTPRTLISAVSFKSLNPSIATSSHFSCDKKSKGYRTFLIYQHFQHYTIQTSRAVQNSRISLADLSALNARFPCDNDVINERFSFFSSTNVFFMKALSA